eukprot:7795722-Pyramimonas_sp.AAC.1
METDSVRDKLATSDNWRIWRMCRAPRPFQSDQERSKGVDRYFVERTAHTNTHKGGRRRLW